MQQVVSITSQGQLTIPKSLRKSFGIKGSVKAVVRKKGKTILVEPKNNFWSLSGSLKSKVKLTDKQLKKTREAFSQQWAKHG